MQKLHPCQADSFAHAVSEDLENWIVILYLNFNSAWKLVLELNISIDKKSEIFKKLGRGVSNLGAIVTKAKLLSLNPWHYPSVHI